MPMSSRCPSVVVLSSRFPSVLTPLQDTLVCRCPHIIDGGLTRDEVCECAAVAQLTLSAVAVGISLVSCNKTHRRSYASHLYRRRCGVVLFYMHYEQSRLFNPVHHLRRGACCPLPTAHCPLPAACFDLQLQPAPAPDEELSPQSPMSPKSDVSELQRSRVFCVLAPNGVAYRNTPRFNDRCQVPPAVGGVVLSEVDAGARACAE